eukprot:5380692-Alexandrium_andersonii.AAC.1
MKWFLWGTERRTIPVYTSVRDLGAQLNFGAVFQSGILSKRISLTIPVVKHVGSLPADPPKKAVLIR